jgi:hypothetical protein
MSHKHSYNPTTLTTQSQIVITGGIFAYGYTDKKEKKIFVIYKEIQMGSGAKSYMRKGFLKYEEMRKYLVIHI